MQLKNNIIDITRAGHFKNIHRLNKTDEVDTQDKPAAWDAKQGAIIILLEEMSVQ